MDDWAAYALAVAGALLFFTWAKALVVLRRGRALAARARRMGGDGERRARRLLSGAGYRIVDQQVSTEALVSVNGEVRATHVRADFVVRKGRRKFVADAKGGAVAASPTRAETRRQLLEYALAYNVDGILLVDAQAGRIHEIAFPSLENRRRRSWDAVLFGVCLGVCVGAFAVLLWRT